MVTVFEFLGEEAIENVITCLNYRVDKVVLFGHHEMILSQKENTERFLKELCGVKTVVFQPLSYSDMQSVLNKMRMEIDYELEQGSDIYFDITGGESLILVAFGMLSKEYKAPIHMFDIPKGRLVEFDEGAERSLSRNVCPHKVRLTLEKLIRMHGGTINHYLQKEIKDVSDKALQDDVDSLWQIVKAYPDHWNPFSEFLRGNMVPDEELMVYERLDTVIEALAASATVLRSVKKLDEMIDALAAVGLVTDIVRTAEIYSFRFKNREVKEWIWEGGSILELHTYLHEKENNEECVVGVHLDWDGFIHPQPGQDVVNEVDILALNGYIPTFISCKSGKMSGMQILHALYELDTVAKRFGGRYAKKVLVTIREPGEVHRERAEEMGIEIR
ncbi:MAG: hypothetical protein K6E50_01305 [Lachnospiraceae bacterium]|nr:hypothetical protein [Lachnospiraceae bacterium]